jgi:hypothetical protein
MLYGFFSMVVFGAIYYILPRVTDRTWHLPGMIGFHFWSSFLGCLASVSIYAIAGYNQSRALNVASPSVDALPVALLEIGRTLQPYFFAQTLALLILIGGHLAFAVNVIWLLLDRNRGSIDTANQLLSHTVGGGGTMNRTALLFLGVFVSLAASWVGVVLVNQISYGKLTPVVNLEEGLATPQPLPGAAQQGRLVYQDLGCATCHTQQVRRQTLAPMRNAVGVAGRASHAIISLNRSY